MKVDLCILSKSEADAERIVEKAKPFFDNILVWTESIDDFSKARNALQAKSNADYVLCWDTDEDFPIEFLKSLKWLLKNRPALCYRFPRKNLPTFMNYPDYQVRLFRRKNCYWGRPVHEIVIDKRASKPADQVDCITLDEYIITHFSAGLYEFLGRFQKHAHVYLKSGYNGEHFLREVDEMVQEVKRRYSNQECRRIMEG